MFKRPFIIATLMTVLVVSPASGDESRAGEAHQRFEQSMARLNLTDEQTEALAPVLEASRSAQQKILSSYGIDIDDASASAPGLGIRQARAMKRELDVVREETLNAVADILTDGQLEEFKRIQAERQAEMRERIREGR